MPIQVATPVFAGSVRFGEKSKAEDPPNPAEEPASEAPAEPFGDQPPNDSVHISQPAEDEAILPQDEPVPPVLPKFKVDKEQVHGFIGKVRTFLAEMLGFEDPANTGWIDIIVKVAKYILDSSQKKAPTPGA